MMDEIQQREHAYSSPQFTAEETSERLGQDVIELSCLVTLVSTASQPCWLPLGEGVQIQTLTK